MNMKITDLAVYRNYLVIFIPVLVYYIVVNHFSLNLPYHDDYLAVLKFLESYQTAPFMSKVALLLHQHNEHRMLSSRLIYVIYYNLTGGLNFRALIFIGNAQMVVVLLILVYFIRKLLVNNWLLPGIAASICLFDLSNYENSTWAMASIANYGVIFFFMLSLYYYSLNSKYTIWLALLFQAVCTFANGNGIIGSFVLLLFALSLCNRAKIYAAVSAFVIFAPLYFFHYHKVVTGASRNSIPTVISNMFNFAGAHFVIREYRHGIYPAMLFSLITIAVLIIVLPFTKKKIAQKETLPLVAVVYFAMATMLVTSVVRFCSHQISSRYLVYPHLIEVSIFALFIYWHKASKFQPRVTYAWLVLLIGGYVLNSYDGWKGMDRNRKELLVHEYYIGSGIWEPSDSAMGRNVSDKACLMKIYCQEEHRKDYVDLYNEALKK